MSKGFSGRKVMQLLKTAWQSNRRLVLIRIIQGLFEALISMADILGIGVIVNVLITGQNRERVFTVIIIYVLIHSGISLIRVLFTWLKDMEERKSTNAVQYRYARQALEVDFPYIQTGRFLNLKKKSMKITWKKVSDADGYQVAYGTKKNFKGAKKKILNKTSLTVKKLKKKKTYYVRVRAYKTVNGEKVFGAWSATKKVKIKK